MKEILAKLVEGKDLTKGADSDRTGNRGADCMFSDSTPHERGNAG